MANGLPGERADRGALYDDAAQRSGVTSFWSGTGEQDRVCGWIDWRLSARCRRAKKSNHAAEPHDQKSAVRTQTLCVCSGGGCHFVPSCFYLFRWCISSPPEVLAKRRGKSRTCGLAVHWSCPGLP